MNESVMIKPVGLMANHLDVREITFTNLLLLEFNPSDMESKYRVVFNRDMFALPNKKAMEVVMHFLFTRLHPQLAYEEFRDCWPVRDKVLEQQFRKVCFNWVSRIQKEDPEARLPRVVQSLFHSPGGDRFDSFLHHFSLYVLVKVLHRDHGKIVSIPTFPTKTVHNQSFTRVMSKALEAHYIVLTKRFLEFTQCAVEVERHWKDFAMETTKEYRSLVKKKRDLERQIGQLDGGPVSSHGGAVIKTDYQEEVEALKRTQLLHKVRDLWAGIEEFYAVQSPQRKIVDSVLKGESNRYQIDGSDIQPRVPDLLLRDCKREIQMRNIEDTFLGGKVNVLSLIQLWNLSLNKIKDQIYKGSIPSFEEHSPTVCSALHTHNAHLANTKTLREAIQETIPAIKEHINQMKSTCSKTLNKNPDGCHKPHLSFNLELGLIPPTPPWSFAAADTPAAERITSFEDTLKLSPDTVSTPEVIQAWRKSAVGKQLASSKVSGSKERSKEPEPSRLPRPKHHISDQQLVAKSTVKKKKKPPEHQKRPLTELKRDRVTSKLKERQNNPSSGLRSQKILADQIADAVVLDQSADSTSASSPALSSRASTPQVQSLEDPISAFGQDAFKPRDLIPRTPAKSEPGHRLSNQKMTAEDSKHVRQPRTDFRYGRFLETILDQSAEQDRPPTPKVELFNTETPVQAPRLEHRTVVDQWKLPLTPQSVKMALFKDTSLPVHAEAYLNHSGLPTPSSDRKELFKEPSPQEEMSVAYDTSLLDLSGLLQQAPNVPNTSLFGRTPMSDERSQCVSHFGVDQTPGSTPLSQIISPGLGDLLLPRGKALDNSGALNQATPPSQYGASPVSYKSLSPFQAQLTPTYTESSPVADTQPPLEALALHRQPILHHSSNAAPETSSPSNQNSLAEEVTYPQHEFDTDDFQKLDKSRKPTGEYLNPGGSPFHQIASSPGVLPSPNSAWRSGVSSGSLSAARSAKAFLDADVARQDSTVPLHEQTAVDRSAKVSSLESSNAAAFLQDSTPSPGYEVDTRALIERLNKIKQTQLSTASSVYTPARSFASPAAGHTPEVRGTVAEVSDSSLPVSRFDQIEHAQLSTTTSLYTPGGSFTSPATGHTFGVGDTGTVVRDTSLQATVLDQMKQSQLSTATPAYTPTRSFTSLATGHTSKVENTGIQLSGPSALASRLNQITQAQRSQQTTPGANTGGDLIISRRIEAALLTPLTPSSRDTPSEENTQNGLGRFTFYSPPQHSFSPPGSPFPSPNDKHPQLSPHQETSPPSSAAVAWTEGLQWETAATPILPHRQTKLELLADEKSPPFAATVDDVVLGSSLWDDVSTPLLVNSVLRSDIDPSKAGAGEAFLRSFNGLDLHENAPSGYTPAVERDAPISPVIGQLIDLE